MPLNLPPPHPPNLGPVRDPDADSIKCFGDLVPINDKAKLAGPGETVLYDGPVRKLCPMAPNNVNTIAAVRSFCPSPCARARLLIDFPPFFLLPGCG